MKYQYPLGPRGQNKHPKKASAGKLLCECLWIMSGLWSDSPHFIPHFALENINKLLQSEPSLLRISVMLV